MENINILQFTNPKNQAEKLIKESLLITLDKYTPPFGEILRLSNDINRRDPSGNTGLTVTFQTYTNFTRIHSEERRS